MKTRPLKYLYGYGYNCSLNCIYADTNECKNSTDTIHNPYKCPYFNPTYGTLLEEVYQLSDSIKSWDI